MPNSLVALVAATLNMTAPALPDPTYTPGVVRTTLASEVCTQTTPQFRNTTEEDKAMAYMHYGLTGNHTGYCSGPQGCEVDHLISLELGGADTVANLWPQPYDGPYNAHEKDRLKNELHRRVCVTHQLSLIEAQTMIRTNWIAAYKTVFGKDPN